MRKKIETKQWRDILAEVSENVSDTAYKTWFKPLTPLEVDEDAGVLYFATEKDFVLKVLEMRYIPTFEECAETILGRKYRISVKLMNRKEIDQYEEKITRNARKETAGRKAANSGEPASSPSSDEFREEYYINPRYTFDNFIVGSNNNYAHAVAMAVAQSPATVYNPLFIYGGSGLGKTHLMNAIGNYIMENDSGARVLYISSETFTNELINAMQSAKNKTEKLETFKQKYRNVDVLLIDDIQFLEGKEATQNEFFHTFNRLYDYEKQIVITSDRHPSKLTNLDDRLRSRFQWNIVADIQPPDFETRVAILLSKAQQEQIEVDDDMLEVINMIAEKVKFNIRELESALTRINSFSKLFDKHIDTRYAIQNLSDIFSAEDYDISCETIKKSVCKHWSIKIADIESSKRKREFAFPRQVAMYLCREMTDLSLPQIGKYFGGRDHTTVMHAYEKIDREIKENELFAREIENLRNEIY